MNYNSGHFEDGDGNKYFVVDKIYGTLEASGWYRVAILDNSGNLGSSGRAFLVNIGTSYWYKNNMSAIFAVNLIYHKAAITKISSLANENIVNKARIVEDTDKKVYLEIFYNTSTKNRVSVEILQYWETFEMIKFATSPGTGTVLVESIII